MMTQTEMDLRTEIAILKDQMNALCNTAIERVHDLNNKNYINAGMGFDYTENKTPQQVKCEVLLILEGLRPTVGEV